ncbi:unnamed protein product [Boreogadus saida]
MVSILGVGQISVPLEDPIKTFLHGRSLGDSKVWLPLPDRRPTQRINLSETHSPIGRDNRETSLAYEKPQAHPHLLRHWAL